MDAGFADTAHLSRVFSSMFGLCPSVAIAGLDERDDGDNAQNYNVGSRPRHNLA